MSVLARFRNEGKTLVGRIYCRREWISSQGYDSSGYYWGTGMALYHISWECAEESYDDFVRASSREEALKIASSYLKPAK